MKLPDDIKDFLPRYLTEESTQVLLQQIDDYAKEGTTDKVYADPLSNDETIYQGDGICDLPIFQYKLNEDGKGSAATKYAPCIILSNTCDISFDNTRKRPINVCYAPLIELDRFYNALKEQFGKDRADNIINDVRKQKITDTLYLPAGEKLKKEHIVFLDKISSIDNRLVCRKNLRETRLFTLSNFGFYLFLLKLSINFTRIQERVDRVFA